MVIISRLLIRLPWTSTSESGWDFHAKKNEKFEIKFESDLIEIRFLSRLKASNVL